LRPDGLTGRQADGASPPVASALRWYIAGRAGEDIAARMRREADALLAELDDEQRPGAALEFGDEAARRWIEYRRLSSGSSLTGKIEWLPACS